MVRIQGRRDLVLVGRYRLVRVLGRGGMGTVWDAVDEVLGREVAIKEVVPPRELREDQQRLVRARTLREARAAARISNPFAVTVYDVVEEDGRPWIVMQKLMASSLADVLDRSGPLPSAQVIGIGLNLLEALAAAHTAGVLHRDVKPGNVMLMDDGRAVLNDFGIATVDGDPSLTSHGMLMGSPAYMAPERARGEPPTTASDLWSLGATLYAAVEGSSPFQREGQLATLNAVISHPTPPIPRLGRLGALITWLLAKDPGERPTLQQARESLAALARDGDVEATVPLATPQESPPQQSPPQQSPPQQSPTQESPPQQSRPVAERREPAAGPEPTAVRPPSAVTATPVVDVPPRPVEPESASGRRRTAAVIGGATVLAAVLGGGILLAQDLNRDGQQVATDPNGTGRPGSATASARSSPAPSVQAPPLQPGQTGATGPAEVNAKPTAGQPAPSPAVAAVPAGFRLHRDPTGFSLAIPNGWNRTTTDGRIYFKEPGGRRFLQVGQTTQPKPDALADWQAQEGSVSRRFGGYQRIRIAPVNYRGWNSADWEFTWQPGGGRLHVLNRGIRVSDERAYALYWSVPDPQWTASRAYFDTFAATFQPAP